MAITPPAKAPSAPEPIFPPVIPSLPPPRLWSASPRASHVGGIFSRWKTNWPHRSPSWALPGAAPRFSLSPPARDSRLMMEHLGYAAMTETPLVLVDVQRGGPSTGLPTLPGQGDMMQARWGSHGDYEIIALCPNSPQECFDLTIDAFNLSEEYRTPVLVMMDESRGPHDGEGGHSTAPRRSRSSPGATLPCPPRNIFPLRAGARMAFRRWPRPATVIASTSPV